MSTLHGKEIQVGDKVWDSAIGWSVVIEIEDRVNYSITTHEDSYTCQGIIDSKHKFPQLFWQEFEIPAHAFEKPKVRVKKYMVLYEYNKIFYTTAQNIRTMYYSDKEEFDNGNFGQNYKFHSLIMESEIEVEE